MESNVRRSKESDENPDHQEYSELVLRISEGRPIRGVVIKGKETAAH